MKPIRRLCLITAAICVLALVAGDAAEAQRMSQSGTVPGVQLSQQQQQQVMQIRQNGQSQIRSIQTNSSLNSQEKSSRIAQVRQNTHDQVMNVLTPQQQQQFSTWWNNRQQMSPGTPAGAGMGPGKGAGWANSTVFKQNPLTQQQQQQLMQIRQATRQQLRAIMQNQSLSEDQKWDQVCQTLKSSHDQIQDLLTPAQQQEFKTWWQNRMMQSDGMSM